MSITRLGGEIMFYKILYKFVCYAYAHGVRARLELLIADPEAGWSDIDLPLLDLFLDYTV